MDKNKYSSDMKKQINDLLLKMQTGENCIGETANELLNLFSVSGSALTKIKAICSRTLDMNLKNDIKDEYSRMDDALEAIWDICHKSTE